MSDASDERGGENAGNSTDGAADQGDVDAVGADAEGVGEDEDVEALRERVEEKYDFENFGPGDMAEMTAEEWDVAFDADTWITGDELLKRVEAELKSRVGQREVFAALEYAEIDGHRCLVAYSDTDYAVVFPDGSVEGVGTVVRDVKPTVALCSMEDYEVEEPPDRWRLPRPQEVPESGSELGNWMLQLLGATQVLVGLAALVLWLVMGTRDQLVLGAVGGLFLLIGILLFVVVANARLSEKFRVQEYRDRLRSIGLDSGERPEFLPIEDEAFETDAELEGGAESADARPGGDDPNAIEDGG